jgi:NarL family two-component system response regulator LiaR
MTIRVVLVDDQFQMHQIVSILLNATSDIQLVGQGANGQDALDLCAKLSPDLVLMDVLMPGMDGLEATRRLHERFPQVKILALSSLQDHESIYDMLQNGATGYITKNSLSDDLEETIRTICQGKMVFSTEAIAQLLMAPVMPGKVDFHLTEREMEVLALMADGLNMPQIAAKLNISQSTVKFHIENICRKFGVHTRSEALILAAKNNLV